MKISNETKVGILAAFAIVILILGYSYLQGTRIFASDQIFYAYYNDIGGLDNSDDVLIKGYNVGKVSSTDLIQGDTLRLKVGFTVKKEIEVPANSEAVIISDVLGDTWIELQLKDGPKASSGDFLKGIRQPALQTVIAEQLRPLQTKIEALVGNIDSVIMRVQTIFDPEINESIDASVTSMRGAIKNIESITQQFDELLGRESAELHSTLVNVERITRTLAENEDKITQIFNNLESVSDTLAKIEFSRTMISVNNALADFEKIIAKANQTDNSLGKLLNDPAIHDNLEAASRELDWLIQDIRLNPERYVTVKLIDVNLFNRKSINEPPSEESTEPR